MPTGKSSGQTMARSRASPSAITLTPATIFQRSGNAGSLAEFGSRGPPDRTTTAWSSNRRGVLHRQGIEDDLQRGCIRHMAVTLTVHIFGLDSPVFGFGEKVHSARGLHATGQESVAKFSKCRKRIAVFNSLPSPAFPGNQCPVSGFVYMSGTSPVPQPRDVFSMSMAHHREQNNSNCRERGRRFPYRGCFPADRWRPLSCEAHRRRARRGLGGYLSRRTRSSPRRWSGAASRTANGAASR